MMNSITEAIGASLYGEFGDRYRIYREAVMQGLEEPCFIISPLEPGARQFVGRRYFRENPFCIQYFPRQGNANEECSAVAERLFSCLEHVTAEEGLMRGSGMRYKVVDGVMSFFVNYDCFTRKTGEEEPIRSAEFRNRVRG